MSYNTTQIILSVVSGLVLFLYAMMNLSDGLKAIAGEKMRMLLARFTGNILSSILVGTIVTTLLDSSSIVIIMTIALVSAELLTFRNSIGVVMGANIGTTISSQIIALDIGEWAALPMVVGLIWQMVSSKQKGKEIGKVIFSFGLLFFSLFIMGEAVEPLKDNDQFKDWMLEMESPIHGIFTGALLTLIIQSSSATVAMAIKLGGKDLLSLAGGVAIMMGAELGTCSDTLIATIGRSRQAIKTGVFHLFFNIVSILHGLLLFDFFVKWVEWVSGGMPLSRKIANAHVLFNILGVLLFVPFVKPVARILERLIKE